MRNFFVGLLVAGAMLGAGITTVQVLSFFIIVIFFWVNNRFDTLEQKIENLNTELELSFDHVLFLKDEIRELNDAVYALEYMHKETPLEDRDRGYCPEEKHPIPVKLEIFTDKVESLEEAFNSWIPYWKKWEERGH